MSIVESQPTYGIHYYEVKVRIILSIVSDLIVTKSVSVYFNGKILQILSFSVFCDCQLKVVCVVC